MLQEYLWIGHAVGRMAFLPRHSGKAEYIYIYFYRIDNKLILHSPRRQLPREAWRDGVGSRMLIQLFLPPFLVTRRFHSFGALCPSLLGLCWPGHFISTLNVFRVCEMRQEICTNVSVGESITSQRCCRITEASPASPVHNLEMSLHFPIPLLYK